MSLSPGQRLGPFEIIAPLGAGGMGEVYRAKDTRLQREVAVKILPAAAATNPERHRRFAQEAIAASALNHPNILAVYDVGIEGDTPYLVSELVEGTSLREEMNRGRSPHRRVLDVGLQIAEGLAAAHAAGIVHRDLKPENVMIARDGRVKILDFGLAKMSADGGDAGGGSDLTVTAAGLLVGTVPYMSPEQARGARIDFRSDQFSLGVMLSEMVTGAHPFRRETAVQTLSAIIENDAPDLAQSQPALPTPLRWVLDRLLAKDPRDRYAHTADLVIDLRTIRDRLSDVTSGGAAIAPAPSRRPFTWAAAGLALLVAAFAIGRFMAPMGVDLASYRLMPLATDAGSQGAPAFSPDGKTLAYVAEVDGVLQVFTRSLSSSTRSPLTRLRFDCHDPFWTADGTRVYFLSRSGYSEALWQVSIAGGAPEKLIDRVSHAAISPDGRTLAMVRDEPDQHGMLTLWFASPPTAVPQRYAQAPIGDVQFDDGYMRFSPDGSKLLLWLLYDAVDAKRAGRSTGFWLMSMPDRVPKPVLSSLAGLRTPPFFAWLGDNRHIVMVRSDGPTPGSHLWVVDTVSDVSRPLTVTNANEGSPAVAPDGRIAHTSEATDFDLVQVPIDGSGVKTLLSSTRNELDPAWSPAGAEFAFVTDRTGTPQIWLQSEEGHWEKPLVTDADFEGSRTIALGSPAFSPDGQRLAYQRLSKDGYRIWISSIAGGPPVQLTSSGYEDAPTWSPDNEWIAFADHWHLAKVRVGAGESAAVDLHRATGTYARPRWSPDGRWILWKTTDGLTMVGAVDKSVRVVSDDDWLVYEWAADSRTVYGLQPTDDLHHFMLVALDVATGRQRVLNPNLGAIPQANQPIRGFSRMKNGAFLTSIARVRSDIWLMDGFQNRGLLDRLWPFRRGSPDGSTRR